MKHTKGKWTQKFGKEYNKLIPCHEDQIDDLMNDHETTISINAKSALMCVSVKATVRMVEKMAKLMDSIKHLEQHNQVPSYQNCKDIIGL